MADQTELARKFIQAIPHSRDLGMELRSLGNGEATIAMPYDARLVGDPETGVISGGAVSALMDTCCGAAVMCHPKNGGGTATLDLRIDYMRPATKGQTVFARAECYRMTRSVGFAPAVAYHSDPDDPIAMGTGTFIIDRPKEDPNAPDSKAPEDKA